MGLGDAGYLGAAVAEEDAMLVGARRVEAVSEEDQAPAGNRVRRLDASDPRLF
jgi:hypothetical protein